MLLQSQVFIIPTEALRQQIKSYKLITSSEFIKENSNFKPHPKLANQPHFLNLNDKYLFISALLDCHHQIVAAVQIHFDLKFQILYSQGHINSQKVGISLFQKDQSKQNYFFTDSKSCSTFIQQLVKKINLKGFHQHFKPVRRLGKGSFAIVYEVEKFNDPTRYAVKAFHKKSTYANEKGKDILKNEIHILRLLNNRNIIKLESVYESQNSVYMVLELLTGKELLTQLREKYENKTVLKREEIQQMMRGILNGLAHMHKRNVAHRDLKPENIVLRKNTNFYDPVIVDFGLALDVNVHPYLYKKCGTPGYVSPEVINYNQDIAPTLSIQCDVFSAGVIFHILLTGRLLFPGSEAAEVYAKNKAMDFDLNQQCYQCVDEEAFDLLKLMLKINTYERITAEQALSHPYLLQKECQAATHESFS